MNFKRNILLRTLMFLFLYVAVCYAKTLKVNAGEHKIMNWCKTHSVKIIGTVSPSNIIVDWSCPQNKDVKFNDAVSLETEISTLDYSAASGECSKKIVMPGEYKQRLVNSQFIIKD